MKSKPKTAKAMVMTPEYRSKVEQDKTKYSRKEKHRGKRYEKES